MIQPKGGVVREKPYKSPDRYLSYDEQCLEWRKGLSEANVRSLASDWLRGTRTPDTLDAFKEYEARWGKYTKGPVVDHRSKKKRSKRNR